MFEDRIYLDLCRRMVERGYYDHARSLMLTCTQCREGEEDLMLPKGFLVYCSDFENSILDPYIEDDVRWTQRNGSLDYQLEEMLKTLDGANIIDSERLSYPVVFNALKDARDEFNSINTCNYRRFSYILPHLLPCDFTCSELTGIKAGSKTKSALAVAILGIKNGTDIITYLSKTTVFGSTGTGKVTRMQLDADHKFSYDEFYLLQDKDIDGDDPLKDAVTNDMLLDSKSRVVGVCRRFETPISSPSLKLVRRSVINPQELELKR